MPNHKLPNYLRMYRKRAGFSQAEMAFLLGCYDGPKVSANERFIKRPCLDNFIAYELLLATPTRELFAGLYADIQEQLKPRVRDLIARLSQASTDPATSHKLRILQAFLDASTHNHDQTL